MKNPPRWFGLLSQYTEWISPFSTNSVLASSLSALVAVDINHQPHSRKSAVIRRTSSNLSNLHLYIAAEKVSPNYCQSGLGLFV